MNAGIASTDIKIRRMNTLLFSTFSPVVFIPCYSSIEESKGEGSSSSSLFDDPVQAVKAFRIKRK